MTGTSEVFINSKFKIQNYIFLSILIVSVSTFFYIYQTKDKTKEIIFGNNEFKIEIVRTEKEREKGLSGRESLCQNCGMLFEFPTEGKHGFWMKGMKFNLDIVWINDGKMVYIAKNVPYDSKEIITPEIPADEVLELNAGTADELSVEVGDRIDF